MKRLILLCSLLILGITSLNAQVEIDQAKAKFIYNFTKFFEWPASERSGDFVIGVVGSNSIYQELDNYTEGKKVIVQNINVKKLSSVDEAGDCHILFVSKYRISQLDKVSESNTKNTLLISDSEKGIDKGAALNFILEGNRLKYEFAASNAMSKGLKFSSRIRDMASKNY